MSLTDDILAQPDFDGAIRTAVAGVHGMDGAYDWVGVYLLEGDLLTLKDDHYLGAPTTETAIALDRGICGVAASSRETIVVDDVRQDNRYIACSPTVRSEIVVPILAGDQLIGVLDLDSDTSAAFGDDDRRRLERIAAALAQVGQRTGHREAHIANGAQER